MTQLEIWQKLQSCIEENGKFPSAQTFANYSGIRVWTVYEIFKKWANEGKLGRRGPHYYVPDNNNEYKPTLMEIPQLVAKGNASATKKVTRWISLTIGLALTAVSIHFTFEFNRLSLPMVWAFILSASTVLFMNIAFVIRNMTKSILKKHVIVVLWLLGITYSVFTAVSGQFNDQRKYVSKDNTSKSISARKIFDKEIEGLNLKKESLLHWRKLEEEYSLNPDLKIENPGTWKSIKKGSEELLNVEKKIEEINEKIISNIENMTDEDRSVFSWIEGVTGQSSDLIQLLIILFPSLFIDLCSTVLIEFAFGEEKWKTN